MEFLWERKTLLNAELDNDARYIFDVLDRLRDSIPFGVTTLKRRADG